MEETSVFVALPTVIIRAGKIKFVSRNGLSLTSKQTGTRLSPEQPLI